MIGQAERIYELKKLYEESIQKEIDSNLISFTSGKGGTGKSFLCLNTGFGLSLLNKKVLIVDLDFNFANINTLLNIIPQKTIFNFFRTEEFLENLIYSFSQNLHFIFGYSGKTENLLLNEDDIANLFLYIKKISSNYDVVLVDTSSGADKLTLAVNSNCNSNVIVSNPEPTSVLDSYSIIKLLSIKNFNNNLFVIVNKCIDEKLGETTFENLNRASGHFINKELKYLGCVNFSSNIIRAITNQEMFLEKYFNDETAEQIKSISQLVDKNLQLANNNHR